jgi:DNA polymerase I
MIKAVWDGKSKGEFENNFDCYIAEALLSYGRPLKTLEEMMTQYKVNALSELAQKQEEKLNENPKLKSLFYEVEMPLSKVLWRMETKGIFLDIKKLSSVGKDIETQLTSVQDKISKETGGGINLNSSLQLGYFLATKMGVPLGKTRTGKYATNESELSKFSSEFPIIADLLKYRTLTKLKSTYVESLIEKVDKDNRIHTTYNQVLVNTGRLASSNPNLQNIPVSSSFGKEIKSCFIASFGHILVSFDYSQQELRILAHLANEPALIQAFKNNLDVHTLTASRLFAVSYEKVSEEQRNIAKTVNFGIIYGMGSYGMSAGLHIPLSDAENFIEQFFFFYPKIKTFYDTYLKNAQINGFVETLLGRRRYVFENPRQYIIDNGTRRALMNFPIQGSAADLMKKAMVDVQEKILSKYPEISLLLQIHDDLVFEIPDCDMKKCREIISEIRSVLCSVYPLSAPMAVEVKMGKRWGIFEKI